MKGRKTLPLIAGAIALMLAFGFLWRQGVTYHTRSWHRATQLAMGDRLSWWDRIYGCVDQQTAASILVGSGKAH